jgi:hypothetical protein
MLGFLGGSGIQSCGFGAALPFRRLSKRLKLLFETVGLPRASRIALHDAAPLRPERLADTMR